MITLAILTISDSSAAGVREDKSGALLKSRVETLGWRVDMQDIVPDDIDAISDKLREYADVEHVPVVLTTGGTGIALRDVTPEATRAVLDRELPGVAEAMRAEGRKSTPLAALSRGVTGSRGTTLIINLPGSPKGCSESFDAVVELIPHIIDLLHGKTEHDSSRRKH
jgi:molybdenum cofactor synthesis domain-containing protein